MCSFLCIGVYLMYLTVVNFAFLLWLMRVSFDYLGRVQILHILRDFSCLFYLLRGMLAYSVMIGRFVPSSFSFVKFSSCVWELGYRVNKHLVLCFLINWLFLYWKLTPLSKVIFFILNFILSDISHTVFCLVCVVIFSHCFTLKLYLNV